MLKPLRKAQKSNWDPIRRTEIRKTLFTSTDICMFFGSLNTNQLSNFQNQGERSNTADENEKSAINVLSIKSDQIYARFVDFMNYGRYKFLRISN